jgi:3',5'-cyclic AMP phosphodiesterase CpdA
MSKQTPHFLLASLALLLPLTAHAAPKAKRTALKQTAPAAGEKFMFVAYGDTRSNPIEHAAIIKEIVGLHPEFVLQSGDLVSDGRNPAQWLQFAQITQPLREAHIAYYPARGNHDVGSYYPHTVTEPFDSGDKTNKLFYAFTRHRNRFIIVDSMEDYDPSSRQYAWLAGELAKARNTAAHTFVMFHEAPFSVGPHGPTPEAQQYLHPLFVKYRPTAVFCGHDHLYYRTVRDGVTYIVTGGGGAPPYRPENRQLALPGDVYVHDTDSAGHELSEAQYKSLIYHAIKCDVDGPRVTMTVIRPDGSLIDRFMLGPK